MLFKSRELKQQLQIYELSEDGFIKVIIGIGNDNDIVDVAKNMNPSKCNGLTHKEIICNLMLDETLHNFGMCDIRLHIRMPLAIASRFLMYHSAFVVLNTQRLNNKNIDFIWKIDLNSLLRFIQLYIDCVEIQEYVNTLLENILKTWVPITYEAFVMYRLRMMKITPDQKDLISAYLIFNSSSTMPAEHRALLKEFI
jgi:thymidylate synthase ThyX